MQAKIYGTSLAPDFGTSVSNLVLSSPLRGFDRSQYVILPGFCDVHVHFREPGFSYKETVETGSLAAARGGFTAVCAMPNVNPVPDSAAHLAVQQEIIRRSACIHVYPYGAITVGEQGGTLSDFDALSPMVCAFSDDGKGVQRDGIMREAMRCAKANGKLIAAHCEVNELLRGGCIHDGAYAKAHGHRGICSESEWAQIARDIALARETGCAYHVCHISTKESVALIRQAKAEGVNITCETCPHYLVLDDSMLQEDGRFKMNPPVRSAADRDALVEGLLDGTIDILATDHAPHAAAEKSRGLEGSAFGVVGLETAFPILYTYLVKPGILSIEQLLRLLVDNPRKRFGLPFGCDFSIWDLGAEYEIDPTAFASMGRATPFAGWHVNGRCLAAVCGGKIVYQEKGWV